MSDRYTYPNNHVTNNSCSKNTFHGILINRTDDSIFDNNTCSDNERCGLSLYQSANNVITNSTITGNTIGVHNHNASWNTIIRFNSIEDNSQSGILLEGNYDFWQKKYDEIEALNNWWGHKSGPYHAVNNSAGSGDSVSDFVLFDPWLSKDEQIPGDNGNGNPDTNGTGGEDEDGPETFIPGFGIISTWVALTVTVALFHRRKR